MKPPLFGRKGWNGVRARLAGTRQAFLALGLLGLVDGFHFLPVQFAVSIDIEAAEFRIGSFGGGVGHVEAFIKIQFAVMIGVVLLDQFRGQTGRAVKYAFLRGKHGLLGSEGFGFFTTLAG